MSSKNKVESTTAVGDSISVENAGWTFGGKTADTFDEHVRKSVPLYDTGHDLVCKLSDYFVKPDSLIYEIGTSTGALLHKLIKHNVAKKDVRWIGIDNEKNMLKKASQRIGRRKNVEFELADATHVDFQKSDLIISYYSVQFIHPKVRQELIDEIYNALHWGGAFIMFEKVRGQDARFHDIFSVLYNDYKLDQDYTPAEILGKTRSLKGVLEPFSTQGNLDLLKRAGFEDITTVMKYLCFEGFLAIK